jgi:membrane associated rhomboid family serine protease
MFSITLIIIIITCLISYTALNNQKVQEDMLFWPAEISSRNQYYRFFSYGLIHADYGHLILNMISLWSIGTALEQKIFSHPIFFDEKGRLIYLVLYITGILVAPIPDYFMNRNNYAYRALGASGAVSAVIFAFILLEPTARLMLLVIPMPAYIFGIVFVVLSTVMARRGGDNIGHGAHLTGAIYGLVFTIIATKIFADYDAIPQFFDTILNR